MNKIKSKQKWLKALCRASELLPPLKQVRIRVYLRESREKNESNLRREIHLMCEISKR